MEGAKFYDGDNQNFVAAERQKKSSRTKLVGDAANLYVSRNIMINAYGISSHRI